MFVSYYIASIVTSLYLCNCVSPVSYDRLLIIHGFNFCALELS